MNICLMTNVTLAHSTGGMEVHAKTLSEGLAAQGHSVTLITTRHPAGIEQENVNNVSLHYLAATSPGEYTGGWWQESSLTFTTLHAKVPFDVVAGESISAWDYARTLRHRCKVPVVPIMQGYTIRGEILSELNRCSSVKEYARFLGISLPEFLFFYYPKFRSLLTSADAIISVSRETSAALQQEFSLDQKKMAVVYNSVDVNAFAPNEHLRASTRAAYRIEPSAKVVLMAGVVHKQKGMHIGLEAFAQLKKKIPNALLLVAGDGPELSVLKLRAQRFGIDQAVVFCGNIPNGKLPGIFNACDVFLNPTLRYEGLGIVNVEAMACGKPIVAHEIGGVQSTIEEGSTGFLIPPTHKSAPLEDALAQVLGNERLAATFSLNARNKALKEFSKESMIENYLRIFRSIIP